MYNLKKEENMLFFFIIFISVPLIEIFLFIKVGEIIGSFQTILLVVLTAIIGSILIKREGIKALNRMEKDNSAFRLDQSSRLDQS